MNTNEMNEPAAEAAEEIEKAQAEITRKGDRKKLASLLKKFDNAAKLHAETEALLPKLKADIAAVLENGDVHDEKLAVSLSTKRAQLDLIPAKLAQIETAMATLRSDLKTELGPCFAEFEQRFNGMSDRLAKQVESYLRPLLVEDFMLKYRVRGYIIPFAKPLRKAQGLIDYIRFPLVHDNWVEAARQLLKREAEADEILKEAEVFGKFTTPE